MVSLTRRRFASLALAPAAALTRRAPSARARNAALAVAGRPNVVLVVADDLDVRAVWAMPSVRSLLIDQGARCERNFATTPLCGPSRASILRGQYAHNHGVVTNTGETGGFPAFHQLERERSTVATWLRGAGYRTGLFGKYLNRYPKDARRRWIPPGWGAWAALQEGGFDYYADFTLNEDGDLVTYSARRGDYLTDVLAARADAFVRENAAAGRPFFACVAPYAPHSPATPAPRHAAAVPEAIVPRVPSFNEADLSDKPAWLRGQPPLTPAQVAALDGHARQRLRALLALDDLIARLVGTLTETGQLERTYVLFTSDNGFHLGEHRLPLGKQTAYDESIRVPLIARGPGIPAGLVVHAITLNIDLAPTIAGWSGVAAPRFVDGRSLAPLLSGDAPADWRSAALIEEVAALRRGDAEPVAPAGDTISPAEPPSYRALRGDDLLYVEYGDGERELYDLAADPYELHNRAGATDAATLERLSSGLAALARCRRESCRTADRFAGA